jgi:putative membrane protein
MPTLEQLPTINASLNFLATILLLKGYVAIKLRYERLHKWCMYAAFGTSVVFLVCYLVYHFQVGSKHFAGPPDVKKFYLAMLASHIVLAALVPFLAGTTIYFGIRDMRVRHRKWAQWTFPIWLYVSVTGVLIYLMLYVFYAPAESPTISCVPSAFLAEQTAL